MSDTTRHGRVVIWLLALAATAAGMYYWGRRSGEEQLDSRAPVAEAAAEGGSRAAPASATGSAPAAIPRYTGTAARPLPSLDTPLRLVLPELQRRAADEPAAACRLAAEMEYCDGLRQRLSGAENNLDNLERQLERMPNDTAQQREQRQRMADGYQSMTEKLLSQSEHCAQVPPITPEQRTAYWRRAALAGHPAAMRHYASGNAFRFAQLLDNLPALAVYRNEAESVARTAAQRGDSRMLASLAYAYSPGRDGGRRSFLSQAVQPNPVESLSLFLQLRDALPAPQPGATPEPVSPGGGWRGGGGRRGFGAGGGLPPREAIDAQISALSRDLSPEQASQARERAAERAQSWTAPVAANAPVGAGGAPSSMFLFQGAVPDVQRQECGPT
ncbi:hypothetical protein [Lysobacter capsici]|uniref:hypothetical protein n=1 Tax=Lysobacter capsici TaxID=435897 RepID=UPI000BBAC76E|nr:hypothetical protein [Lysobacter capsici]ATE72257.1 hypothetical protein CNO08_13415 [Lysobacter capsici]